MADEWECMADGQRFWCARVWEHGIETWSGKLGAKGGRIHVKATPEPEEALARAIAERGKQGYEPASPPPTLPSTRKLKKPRWRARLDVDPRYRGASKVQNAILDEDVERLDRVFAKKQADVLVRPRPEWEGEPPEPPELFGAAATKVALLDVFLAHGADPRVVVDGTTALHFAARNAQVRCSERLVEVGALVNARDARGATPLHEAAGGQGGEPIVRRLVALGADVAAVDDDRRTPLHYAIVHGMREGNIEAARALIEAGAPLEVRDAHDMSPLELCRDYDRRFPRGGWRRIEATLLSAGASAVGSSPARDELLELMTVLDHPEPLPASNLAEACERGDVDAVEAMLADGADPNGFDVVDRRYPLAIAIRRGHHDIAAVLREAGASEPTTPTWPPRPDARLVGVDVGAQVGRVMRPAVDALLGALPADPVPRSPNPDVVQRCLSLVSELDVATLSRLRAGGRSVLELACLRKLRPVVDTLLAAGVRVEGHEALLWAGFGGDVEIVRRLIEHGADPNTSSEHGSALHAAASAGSLDAVRALVDAGAEVTHETGGGHTAFNQASGAQRNAIRRFLRQHVRPRSAVKLRKRKRMFVPSDRSGTADRDEVARVPRIAGVEAGIDGVAEVLSAAHRYERDLIGSRVSGVTHGVFVIQLVDSAWTFLLPTGSTSTIDDLAPRLARSLDAHVFLRHRDRQVVLRFAGASPPVFSDHSFFEAAGVWLPPAKTAGDGPGDRGDVHELHLYGLERDAIVRIDRVVLSP